MLLILNNEKFESQQIIFGEKTDNNIIENSFFYPIYYSNTLFTLNAITYRITLYNIKISKHFNKYKLEFNNKDIKNMEVIYFLMDMERNILDLFKCHNIIINKQPSYKITTNLSKQQIKGNFQKINENNHYCNLLIKISGIWEDNDNFGLNYKFLDY